MKTWLAPLVDRRTWLGTAYLMLAMANGIAWFTWVVTMLSLGGGLAVTFVGVPLIALTVLSGRVIGRSERWLAANMLGERIGGPPAWSSRGSWWDKMRRALADKPGWKGLAYGALLLPVGIVSFTVTVTAWSVALACVGAPLAMRWSDGAGGNDLLNSERIYINSDYQITGVGYWAALIGIVVVGVFLLGLVPRLLAPFVRGHLGLVRSLLGGRDAEVLEQRVTELQASRDASVDASASELRRIERDLHDGAQQRLVSVAMQLGMAKERLADVDDPRARELVERAHDEAKQAITELRDLVRGIHPAVLTDRGLDAAVSALAARCPVPVRIDNQVDRRLPAAIETCAYFVVGEALTNVAKHSRATRASVDIAERIDESPGGQRSWLVVAIHDDGIGGADGAASGGFGGGLRGLRDRVASVEGRLRVASPEGGPTTVIAELPL